VKKGGSKLSGARLLRKIGNFKVLARNGNYTVSRETVTNERASSEEIGSEKAFDIRDSFDEVPEDLKESVNSFLKKFNPPQKRCIVCGRPIREGIMCVLCEEKKDMKRISELRKIASEEEKNVEFQDEIQKLRSEVSSFLKKFTKESAIAFLKAYKEIKRKIPKRKLEEGLLEEFEVYVKAAKRYVIEK